MPINIPGNCSSRELGCMEIVATLPMSNMRWVYTSAATSSAIFVRIIRAFIFAMEISFSYRDWISIAGNESLIARSTAINRAPEP